MIKKIKFFIVLTFFGLVLTSGFVNAQSNYNANYTANDLLPRVQMSISPHTGSFAPNSTFKTQVYVNTNNNNINAIDLYVNFDNTKLSLLNATAGKSIFNISVATPDYDNNKGIVTMSGVNTKGIKTSKALVAELTFKVIGTGQASVSISDKTAVYLNDGYGSNTLVTKDTATYTLTNNAQIISLNAPSEDVGQLGSVSYSEDSYRVCSYNKLLRCYPLLCALLLLAFLELIIHYFTGRHLFTALQHTYHKANSIRFEDAPVKTPTTNFNTSMPNNNPTNNNVNLNSQVNHIQNSNQNYGQNNNLNTQPHGNTPNNNEHQHSHNQDHDRYSHIKHL